MKYKFGDKVKVCDEGRGVAQGQAIVVDCIEETGEYEIMFEDCPIGVVYYKEDELQQTNRQWLESLSNEEATDVVIIQLFEVYLEDVFPNGLMSFKEFMLNWLQSEHRED